LLVSRKKKKKPGVGVHQARQGAFPQFFICDLCANQEEQFKSVLQKLHHGQEDL
jgi:hypothetical protein